MKRIIVILTIAILAISCLAGCNQKDEAANNSIVLEDNGDGTMTCLDTENSPLEGGLSITVDKNEAFVNFQITDKDGNETAEYYKFTPSDSTCHRYRYVSAMEKGYNYFFNYTDSKILKIEDIENNDITEKTKEAGRFDGAESETKEHVNSLMSYFSDSFSMTIDEAIK
ncbi:MAG: hypothetical protein K8S14_04415 [Actinomycetia bacterium]|nr:hypothetical protein [Actinomycetes bacterium]